MYILPPPVGRRTKVIGARWWRFPTPSDKKTQFRVLSPAEELLAAAASDDGGTMSLLLDNQFGELPPDKSVDTKLFLEAVSHLPSFFGECVPFSSPHLKKKKKKPTHTLL